MIPKLIHMCWLGNDPLPPKLQFCVDSWKKYLPDYEIMLWDNKRFDVNSLEWTAQAFEVKKYAFVADYIRFYALYNYGGIYLDTDVEVIRSFDDVMHLPYFLGQEAVVDGLEVSAFGVEKGNEWVKDAMDYYSERAFVGEGGIRDEVPVPIVMMSYLGSRYQIKPIKSPDEFDTDPSIICYLPNDWFNAHPRDDVKGLYYNITENTHCIHHFANSWLEDEYGGGPLHKMYYKITGKNWRLRDGRFQLYGTDKKIKI